MASELSKSTVYFDGSCQAEGALENLASAEPRKWARLPVQPEPLGPVFRLILRRLQDQVADALLARRQLPEPERPLVFVNQPAERSGPRMGGLGYLLAGAEPLKGGLVGAPGGSLSLTLPTFLRSSRPIRLPRQRSRGFSTERPAAARARENGKTRTNIQRIPVGSSTRTVRPPPFRAPRVMSTPCSQTIERVTERPRPTDPTGTGITGAADPVERLKHLLPLTKA